MRVHPAAALLIMFASAAIAAPALAAWPNQPAFNLPITTAPGSQSSPRIVPDGAGGAIITWEDDISSTDPIHAQHVLASGAVDPVWPAGGTALSTTPFYENAHATVSDGAGGAIATWLDYRGIPGGTSTDIYAQHVRASGTVDPAWTTDGRAICAAPGQQEAPAIVSDGAGGAIIAWHDFRNATDWNIFAQHVKANGLADPVWPANGRALCTAGSDQQYPIICSDGGGGAIVAWRDRRSGNLDVYAQHVLAAGTVDPVWPSDGRAICAESHDQNVPKIVSDDAGGAIVAWQDSRGASPLDIYAQHVLATGAVDPGWPLDGRGVCTATGDQEQPAIVTDGAGGAIVTWMDGRSGSGFDIYAQHVLSTGAVDPAWPVDGRTVCAAAGNQQYPAAIPDGAGGALVAWFDHRGGTTDDIYAQHVQGAGSVDTSWPADGRAVSTAANDQQYPVLASDDAGGAIAAWQDYRAGGFSSSDVYAQRVARFGYLGTPEAVISGARDVPNDNGGRVKLSWYASYLEGDPYNVVTSYYLFRSVPPGTAAAAVPRGARLFQEPGDEWERESTELYATRAAGTTYFWEFLGTVATNYVSGYSYLAPTAEDSTGAGNPRTAFMVQARSWSGQYWNSAPDSGYSVDNLPPAPPVPFTGQYAAGTTHLHWGANSEPDLAGYRLYRGTSAGFTPAPGNRIATPADTGYTDNAGAPYYYKLSAVDVHGNESGFSTLLPSGTADASDLPPRVLSLERPMPNPAMGRTTLRYALPREARVQFAIYDAAGRCVRTLVEGIQAAGEHAVVWDLRDESGRAVGAGLYFVRLSAAGETRVRRFSALR